MKLKKDKNNYSEEYVKKHRTFPVKNTVLLVFAIIIQIILIIIICAFDPQPQDVIKNYTVTAEPKENGTLDIQYDFVWQALDESEPLTWVEIGMPNSHYTVYEHSVSNNISSYEHYVDEDYTSLDLYFERAYNAGDTLKFSFKINLSQMLCKDSSGYFYELIPCWFNNTPVENYEFRWKLNEQAVRGFEGNTEDGYLVTRGSLDCGEYRILSVKYTNEAFEGVKTVEYEGFDDSGAYNELEETEIVVTVILIIVIIVLMIFELFVVDSYVSYNRGRGFLTGYGYRVHTYGRINPKYEKVYVEHIGSSSRGGGGGCACACACACAGGGRAGCSQKDTFTNT